MKLKHIFAAAISLLMVTACNDDNTIGTLGNIELDKTYVSIPAAGGEATVTVKAAGDWQFDKVFQVITKNKDNTKDTTYYNTPSWLKLDKESGSAGETKVTLHADATNGGRDTQLEIVCNGQRQYLQVMQGDEQPQEATVADVLEGPDGKTYRVTGTVEDIYNTTYGNWYLRDKTGRVTIYGTLDKDGKTKNFASLGIENGDVVTIEGPKTTYGTTVELVDVTVLKITKAMLKLIDVQSAAVPQNGGDFVVKVAFKGKSVNPAIPAEAQNWLGVSNIRTIAGVPSKTIANPADTALITFHCQSNSGAVRSANVPITSGSTTLTATVKQDGAAGTKALPFTVSQAISYIKGLGDATSPSQVYIKGTVSEIAKNGEFGSKFGNGSFFLSEDGTYSGSNDKDFEAFRVLWLGNKKWAEGNAQIAPGAEVVVCATVKSYNGVPETASGYVYSVNGVTTDANGIGTLAAPFNALGAIEAANAGSSSNVYVQGIVSQYANKGEFTEKYGNGSFFISEDGTYHNDKAKDFEAYQVYWLGGKKWTAANGQVAAGDKVVIYGPLTTYNGQAETKGKGAAYIYSLNGATAAKRRR